MITLREFLDTCEGTNTRIMLAYDDGHYICDTQKGASGVCPYLDFEIAEWNWRYEYKPGKRVIFYIKLNVIGDLPSGIQCGYCRLKNLDDPYICKQCSKKKLMRLGEVDVVSLEEDGEDNERTNQFNNRSNNRDTD